MWVLAEGGPPMVKRWEAWVPMTQTRSTASGRALVKRSDRPGRSRGAGVPRRGADLGEGYVTENVRGTRLFVDQVHAAGAIVATPGALSLVPDLRRSSAGICAAIGAGSVVWRIPN